MKLLPWRLTHEPQRPTAEEEQAAELITGWIAEQGGAFGDCFRGGEIVVGPEGCLVSICVGQGDGRRIFHIDSSTGAKVKLVYDKTGELLETSFP